MIERTKVRMVAYRLNPFTKGGLFMEKSLRRVIFPISPPREMTLSLHPFLAEVASLQ